MPAQTRATTALSKRKSQNASNPHHDTPKKIRVRAMIDMRNRTGHYAGNTTNTAIFDLAGVSRSAGKRIVSSDSLSERTFPYKDLPNWKETRGAPETVTPSHIKRCEDILREADVEERSMTWETLAQEAEIYHPELNKDGKKNKWAGKLVSGRTLQKVMGRLDYYKCVACQKGWVSKDLAKRRLAFAKEMLRKYPEPWQWKRVRFSDEVHFGLGPQGKLMIIRKKGQRYCHNCIQEEREPREADKKKLHAWGAVGYNFKSDLVFYDIPTNNNGKMTHQKYIEILEEHVKPWIQRGDDFVLEEDRDTSHGIGKKNIVKTWKEQNHLECYFNMTGSPDLSPSENSWQPTKAYVRRFQHWEVDETQQLAKEGWYEHLSQDYLNRCILSMPERLQAVIDAEGKMTGY